MTCYPIVEFCGGNVLLFIGFNPQAMYCDAVIVGRTSSMHGFVAPPTFSSGSNCYKRSEVSHGGGIQRSMQFGFAC
jgi:hypothetical protein